MNEAGNNRSIQIQESAVGSAIVSGDGNTIYVIQQSTEQKRVEPEPQGATEIGPNPYKGLAAFKESDADRYYGREAQIERLWQRFQSLYAQSDVPRFLPILGPSGCGKSSLARAGFIPELARNPLPGKAHMRVAVLVPGARPLEALAGVLAKAVTDDPFPVEKAEEFERVLKKTNDVGECEGLRRIANMIPDIRDTPLVILVDQFEEVYSLCKEPEQRQAFINNLLHAASEPTGEVSVVITLRSDFLGETQRQEQLNQVIGSDQSAFVPAMTMAELRRAIAEPAKQAGRPLDDATIDLLVQDTKGREGALPLLQFALARIWDGLSQGKTPATTYREMGGVGGALAGEAQKTYDRLSDAEKNIAQRVFVGLVQLGEGTRDTRRRTLVKGLIAKQDAPDAVQQVIRQFSASTARLITLSSADGQDIAEVTHEALFEHWQQLNEWLDNSRDDIRFQRRLEAAAVYWEEQGCPDGSLWRRPDLDLMKSYHQKAKREMTPLQLRFFRASIRAAQRRKVLSSVGVGALVVLSGITSLLTIRAQRTQRESFASQLATKSEWIGSQSSVLRTTSALLAVKASKTFTDELNAPLEVDQALRSSLKLLPVSKGQFDHEGEVNAVSFSPDGKTFATASDDNTARIWDAHQTRGPIATLNHEGEVNAASFSPDGKTIATASEDNTARIWNAKTGEEIATLNHERSVRAASFSPDGKTIATASWDNTARIWNAKTGEEIVTLNHEESINAVSYSPDGKTIATASYDNTARIWNVETGEEIATLNHESSVLAASFSPDGNTLATASWDNTARIWNAKTGEEIATLNHKSEVWTASFSPDGNTLATASRDSTARLWDATTGEEIATFNHAGSVLAASFSPDGNTLATTSADNTARIWNVQTGEEIATLSHEDSVIAASYSPNGKTIVTASGDNTARIWNAETGKEIATLNHEDLVLAASYSPDGNTLATASWDSTARIWNVQTGKEIATLNHEGAVFAVSFSPDGNTLATASIDRTARIWNAKTGEEIATLNHEGKVIAASFSPDGNTLATTSADNTARLWNAKTGEEIATLNEKAANPPNLQSLNIAVSFSPDGNTLATTSADNTARIWNVQTGEEIATLSHEDSVIAA
ncbi:MAG: WD40 repeat domain-containing protein, partial [Cyanobacteria bacterium P01_D01_bin.105]